MSILIDSSTRVLVQGITGREGEYHTRQMMEYGTTVAAGCTPGKGGRVVNGVPVFNTVEEAVRQENVDTSIIFVPPKAAVDALYEAADAGIELIICITEGIPALDMMQALRKIRTFRPATRVLGPNCPGVISPGRCSVSIMPARIFRPGGVGIISRSGTLTYQVAYNMLQAGIGQSTVVGVGGDPFIGLRFIDVLQAFNADDETTAVCIIGEIGGSDEEEAAEYIKESVRKPVIAYVAGQTAPPGKRMGHAGAIVAASTGTAESKIKAFEDAGVPVGKAPYLIAGMLRTLM